MLTYDDIKSLFRTIFFEIYSQGHCAEKVLQKSLGKRYDT